MDFELRVVHRRRRRLAGVELVEHRHQHEADDKPDDKVLEKVIQRNSCDAKYSKSILQGPQARG
jgi:hypothetical protein